MAEEYEKDMGGRRSPLPKISDNTLKLIGAVLMTLYFFSVAVIQNGVLRVNDYTPAQLNDLLAADPEAMLWASIASLAEVAGMIPISIFAYLLVQGVAHTSNMRRYALSVLAFALISEIPYDLAVYGQVWSWESQNPLWAVFIALAALWLMKSVEGRGAMTWALSAVAALGGCLWTVLFRCKFGWGFVLIASALYLLRGHRALSLIAGLGASLSYITPAMGFIFIAFSNGERRTGDGLLGKYAYYVYYPAILLLMTLWARVQRGT